MNQTKKDGGPAFPVAHYDHQTFNVDDIANHMRLLSGMSMRQHYAGLAMQGMVSSIHNEEAYLRLRRHAAGEGLTVSQWIARDSIKQADAMIAQSEQPSELERVTAERDELARGVLDWWEEHQHDAVSLGEDGECNLYDEEPAFVTLAIGTGVQP